MNGLDQVITDLAGLSGDPYRFVLYSFPWGEPGTELERSTGPEAWQTELLCSIRDGLLTPNEAILQATASGHGIGKSACVSWIILWSISTYEDTRGVVTANTETQLKTKTWAELGKWYRLFIGRDLFKLTATAIFSADANHERTWRIDMVPWSERNTEAFAGLHNKGRRVVLIFDEASNIPDVIWETAEGALTDSDTQILWCVYGNPTRNTGRFKDCFGSKSRWIKRQVDSRTVSITNKAQFAKWIQDYGEDSDFVRVRVKGTFPRAGSMQFISTELVDQAIQRDVSVHLHDPLIIGVDVARFGDDASVIAIRKGRDCRSFAARKFRSIDTMTLAGKVAEAFHELRADAVFVDGGGVGGGVVDRLRQLRVPVWDIQFGAKADMPDSDEPERYANKRAEIWGALRRALRGLALPDDKELRDQLISVEYGYNQRDEIQLERKSDMKKRGLDSPDYGDALALTFAYPVMSSAGAGGAHQVELVESEYDPFNLEVA